MAFVQDADVILRTFCAPSIPRAQDRQAHVRFAAPCRRCHESKGGRVEIQLRSKFQALSRPDNLAHDSRKASLGTAEYPPANSRSC